MTKKDLQKELLEKVKPGTKPSHLKRLKRSKSDSELPRNASAFNKGEDIPPAPPPPKTRLEQLEQENSQLKAERQQTQEKLKDLSDFAKSGNTSSSETATELDQSLISRHKSLKDWFQQYQKNQTLEKELAENINEASNELEEQDKKIIKLRSEVSKLKQQNQSLQKDLSLSQRLAELRKDYSPSNSPEIDYLKYVIYSLLTVIFTLWLMQSLKEK